MFFARRRDGSIAVHLSDEWRDLLGRLVADLRELLIGDADDGLRRLYPTAYPTHEELDAEYQSLMHGDLIESRLAALDLVEESLGADTLTDEQLTAWMQAVNSARLVLGTRLDVSEDETRVSADHPDAASYALFDLLVHWLGEMVEVLAASLPPAEG